jgi:hypothetical protein
MVWGGYGMTKRETLKIILNHIKNEIGLNLTPNQAERLYRTRNRLCIRDACIGEKSNGGNKCLN